MMATTQGELPTELEALRARVAELESRDAPRDDLALPFDPGPLLEQVLQCAAVIAWAIDRDGLITMSRGRGLSVLGLQSDEVVGRSVFDMYRDYPAILASIGRALAGEEFDETVELDGVYFDTHYRPVRGENGGIAGVFSVTTVVTERVRAELASERELLFAKALQTSPAGIVVTRPETGEILDVNDTFLQISGYRRDELIGRTTRELNFWIDPHQRDTLIEQLKATGSLREMDYNFRAKRGELVSVRLSAELIEWDGERCILSVCEDVTARRLAERAYRESQKRYQTLARVAPVGIFHADADGRPMYVNEHWCRITGLTPEQTRDGGWTQAVHTDDRPRVRVQWQAAVDGQRPFRSEFRVQQFDGPITWVLGLAEPEAGRNGGITSYVGTITDITAEKNAVAALEQLNAGLEQRVRTRTEELHRANAVLQEQIQSRKRALENLQESEARWRSLVQNAPDYILMLNPEGTIRFINHTLPQFSPEHVVGTMVFEYLPAEHHDHLRQLLARVAQTGEPTSYDFDAVRLDGQRRWFSARIGPIRRGEAVVSLIAVVTDVTPRRQAEETARHRQDELAHVARRNMMGEMVAVLAHELNNPLAAIANFAHGGIHRLQGKRINRASLTDALQDIAAQAGRASETIRRLRSFLQRREVRQAPVDPNVLIDDAVSLAEPALRRHRVRVRRDRSEGLPQVVADRIQIEQVLINLLLNGGEAMQQVAPEQRVLTVRTAVRDGGQLVVSVRDVGRGLPENFEEHIFEPFYSTKPGGLGMGLSISRSIVEAHGGRLWAAPNPPTGAAFEFSLPVWSGSAGRG